MPTEDHSGPRRDRKALWLLPILVLGLVVLVSSWKKPASTPPVGPEPAGRMKQDAYSQAVYHLNGRLMQGQPKGYTVIGFAPYGKAIVTELGPARFHCSSFFTVRSPAGGVQKEHWQCVMTKVSSNWLCDEFRHAPTGRDRPGAAQPGATVADKH